MKKNEKFKDLLKKGFFFLYSDFYFYFTLLFFNFHAFYPLCSVTTTGGAAGTFFKY